MPPPTGAGCTGPQPEPDGGAPVLLLTGGEAAPPPEALEALERVLDADGMDD